MLFYTLAVLYPKIIAWGYIQLEPNHLGVSKDDGPFVPGAYCRVYQVFGLVKTGQCNSTDNTGGILLCPTLASVGSEGRRVEGCPLRGVYQSSAQASVDSSSPHMPSAMHHK